MLLVGALSEGALSGGVEIGISMILRSPLAERHGIRLFNTFRRPDPNRRLLARISENLAMLAAFTATLLREWPRVVHVKASEGVNFFQGIGYCAIARLLGRRVLFQLHGGSFDSWYQQCRPVVRAVIRLGLRVPSEILVLSAYWRSVIAGLAPRAQLHVVPNGVELGAVVSPTRDHGDELHVVAIGALGKRKGHFEIVEAAALLKDLRLRFVLAGPDEFGGETEALRRLAGELGVEGCITFPGIVHGDAKWRLLADADVFLLPSHNENMPNAVIEAMAAGLPVVCTPVGALQEMIGADEGAIFVTPGDPAGIAAALRTLAGSRPVRVEMGRTNRRTVEQRYSFDRVAAALDGLYHCEGTVTVRTAADAAYPRR